MSLNVKPAVGRTSNRLLARQSMGKTVAHVAPHASWLCLKQEPEAIEKYPDQGRDRLGVG